MFIVAQPCHKRWDLGLHALACCRLPYINPHQPSSGFLINELLEWKPPYLIKFILVPIIKVVQVWDMYVVSGKDTYPFTPCWGHSENREHITIFIYTTCLLWRIIVVKNKKRKNRYCYNEYAYSTIRGPGDQQQFYQIIQDAGFHVTSRRNHRRGSRLHLPSLNQQILSRFKP